MSIYRQADPQDIVAGAIVHILGDDGDLHAKVIEDVLRPNDQWKAFCADDGCRYGLDGCFVEKPTTAAEIEAWRHDPTMTNETKITESWARYHGPPLPGDDEIPQAPPAYARGYRDGVASTSEEVRSVLDQLDHLAEVWGDEGVFRRCRDRLREIVK